jgi:hypothetical protein
MEIREGSEPINEIGTSTVKHFILVPTKQQS